MSALKTKCFDIIGRTHVSAPTIKTMETQQPQKRPVGMTILLVLSFINACWNILNSLLSLFMVPRMSTMMNDGQFEEMMKPFAFMSEDFTKTMKEGMHILSQIDPKFYYILIVLFIASLIGVIMMFKGDKRGFHIYSIAQICMLIDHSVFVYPLQKPSPFTSDLIITVLFILLYYLYLKRMQMVDTTQDPT